MTESRPDIAITPEETLRILGIKKALLLYLERAAEVPHIPDRKGYTNAELKSLVSALKRILGRRK
jgi:hypothetical protein